MEQNTQEWLQFRMNKIGGSDAPVIMGESPYSTPFKLWEEKMGFSTREENDSMRRGKEMEPIALKAFCDIVGRTDVRPEVLVHESLPWMMASMDGISAKRDMGVEIKCPSRLDHEMAISGKVPPKYYAQLQHQMEVSGLSVIHYFSYRENSGVIVVVDRDNSYIEKMKKKEKEFYECMISMTPPSLSDKDVIVNETEEWALLSKEWQRLSDTIKTLEDHLDSVKAKMIEASEGKPTKGFNVSLIRCFRKGNIVYKNIPELESVDLEKYRGKPSEYWMIKSY